MKNKIILLFAIITSFISCTSIDKTSLRSTSNIPESAKTDYFQAHYDSSKPFVLLAVEPVYLSSNIRESRFSEKGKIKGGLNGQNTEQEKMITNTKEAMINRDSQSEAISRGAKPIGVSETNNGAQPVTGSIGKSQTGSAKQTETNMNVGISGEYQKNRNYVEINYANTEVAQKLTMQMTSALSGVKNFRLLDYAYFTRDTGRFLYKPKIKSGEVGPLLIRAAITEYTEVVESDSKKTNIATLYRGSNYKRTGIVGLDFSIINPTNGNIVLSFPIKTTFSSQEKSNSVGLISDMARSKKFAQSALDQALRQALYEASKKIYYSLLED